MGLVARKSDFVVCKRQRHRPVRTSVRSDQCLSCSLYYKFGNSHEDFIFTKLPIWQINLSFTDVGKSCPGRDF